MCPSYCSLMHTVLEVILKAQPPPARGLGVFTKFYRYFALSLLPAWKLTVSANHENRVIKDKRFVGTVTS